MARELTVMLRGDLIVFESKHTDEEALEALTSYVQNNQFNSEFARSLIEQSKERELSDKQMTWVHKLVSDFEASKAKTDNSLKMTFGYTWINERNGHPPTSVPLDADAQTKEAIEVILKTPEKYKFVPKHFEYYLVMLEHCKDRRSYLRQILKADQMTYTELIQSLNDIATFYHKGNDSLPKAYKSVLYDIKHFQNKVPQVSDK